jgi:hypothetical protein
VKPKVREFPFIIIHLFIEFNRKEPQLHIVLPNSCNLE